MKKLGLILFSFFLILNCFGQVRITEINYNSDSSINASNWFEIHNNGSSAVSLNGWTVKKPNSAIYTFPAATNLAANAYLVVSDSVTLFNNIHSGVTNVVGNMPFKLNNTSDTIILRDNNSTVIESVRYENTSWRLKGADGWGRTLEVYNEMGNPNDSTNWYCGCMNGSPGGAWVPCNDPLVVSEINYASQLTMDAGDWFEIHNRTNASINVSNYYMKDKNDSSINTYHFPNGTSVPANGYLIIYKDLLKFNARHPGITNKIGPFATFGFGGTGDAIRLWNANNKLIWSVAYNNTLPWDTMAWFHGYTLELKDQTAPVYVGTNWMHCTLEGDPNLPIPTSCYSSVNAAEINPVSFHILENPCKEKINIEFTGDVNLLCQSAIRLMDLQGKIIFVLENPLSEEISIDASKFSSGLYLLQFSGKNFNQTEKIIVQ